MAKDERLAGHALLATRVEALSDALDDAAAVPIAPLELGRPTVTTGAGASEAPARALAWALQAAGGSARFEPLSTFAHDEDVRALRPENTRLVVVSQGLSPNARLALARHGSFAETVVLTALELGDARADDGARRSLEAAANGGARVLRHGPDSEDGLLARVVGPSLACALAFRLAGLAAPAALGAHRRAAMARARATLEPSLLAAAAGGAEAQRIALVTAGSVGALAHGARWRLLEAAGVADPPVWDALQFAHGPFQQIHGRHALLCGLERPHDGALFDRLARLLIPERHRLWRVKATLDAPWCAFEHEAAIDALALALGERGHHDLANWPGRGCDGPLYDLGRDDG